MNKNSSSTFSLIKWASSPGYAQGVVWMVCLVLISNINDILMKLMGERLAGLEVAFFRCFFSLISLLPFLIFKRVNLFKIANHKPHIIRGVLGVMAIICCCYSVINLPLTQVTTISFTHPLFVMLLALFLLRERVSLHRWGAAMVGFGGIIITMFEGSQFTLNSLVFIGAMLLFALQDIIIKNMVVAEEKLVMLFYFALITTVLSFIPALWVWKAPTLYELGFLFLLGIGANLIQVFVFLAYNATEVSALAPFRYVELLFSATFSYLIFGEVISQNIFAGAVLIIPSTLYIVYSEIREEKLRRLRESEKQLPQENTRKATLAPVNVGLDSRKVTKISSTKKPKSVNKNNKSARAKATGKAPKKRSS